MPAKAEAPPIRTLAIIPARLGSTRFPGKVQAPLCGLSVLAHVLNRVQQARVEWVAVAWPDEVETPNLISGPLPFGALRSLVAPTHPDDVFGRFEYVLRQYELTPQDAILRVTSDCPVWSPVEGRKVLELYRVLARGYPVGTPIYCHNLPGTDGWDAEVWNLPAWELARQHRESADVREHVTSWLRTSGQVLTGYVPTPTGPKCSLDYPDELPRLETLVQEGYGL